MRLMKRPTALGLSLAVIALLLQSVLAYAAGTWTATGSLASARQGQTATLLQNGKVLVAGGVNDAGVYLSSAELYDPGAGTWSSAGSMSTPRSGDTATLLASGKVLVAGGFVPSIGVLSSAELYDPAANTWTLTGSMTDTRHGFTATLLPSGEVLAAGGGDSSIVVASAELYDPTTGKWSATGTMVGGPRWLHAATLLASGEVLVAGGQSGTTCGFGGFEAMKSAELYDPATGTWTLTGSLTGARHDFTLTLLPSGKVLAAAGALDCGGIALGSAELYDPSKGVWSSTGSLATARSSHTATLLPSGLVLVAGGLAGGLNTPPLASVELYDPAAGSWGFTGAMGTARGNHSATLLPNEVLVAGGDTSTGSTATAELYSFSADLSITMSASPDPVVSGNQLTYTIIVTNNGPQDATGVMVTDALPAKVHFDSLSSTQGTCTRSTSNYSPKGGTVACSLGGLANGASATMTIVVTATKPGTLTNTATVTGDQLDPNLANNSATATTTVVGG
jgi:uncharacterized repeat protein (TIGR01451 family)